MGRSNAPGDSRAPRGKGDHPVASWWRSLKTGEKMGWLGAITGVAAVTVTAIGLVPSYYDTFVKGGDKPAQPVRASRSSASASTSAVKVDKITFPVHDGQSVVGARPLAKANVKPLVDRLNGQEAISVLRPLGNTDAVDSTISLHISGGQPTPVRIINMHAVTKCRAPLNGVLFYNPNAGETAATKIGFNLDEPDPPARQSSRDINGVLRLGGEYFVNHEYVLSAGETASFTVIVTTSKYYCEFHLVMDLLVDGKSVYQNIDNGGKPFTVSAGIGRYSADHIFNYNFSSYQMFMLSPIVQPYPASGWQLGDPRRPPAQ